MPNQQIDCTGCDASCCRHYKLSMIPGEALKELLSAHYDREVDSVFIHVYHKCEQLDENNRCKIYDKRPQTCRDYICTPEARPNVVKIEVGEKSY